MLGYEIDFLGVGSESKSGDAIAVRYGNLAGPRSEQKVIVIDGGFKDTGAELVAHIRKHYQTDTIDLVISTHPDQDHINGLTTVLDELEVKELWIHQPWLHNQGLSAYFQDGRVTDISLGESLKANLGTANDLVKQAERLGITVREPFTGTFMDYGNVRVIGPSQDYYESLVPEFDGMPKLQYHNEGLSYSGLLGTALKGIRTFFAQWGVDDIDDEDTTSAKNNSSVITQIIIGEERFIFTGDSGVTALNYAADQLDLCINPAQLKFFQIPHHGSHRNVGPSVLNRIIGNPLQDGDSRILTVIASTAANGEPKHPNKTVLNAFTHRGAKVAVTRGITMGYSVNAPQREGWSTVEAEPYYWQYEKEV